MGGGRRGVEEGEGRIKGREGKEENFARAKAARRREEGDEGPEGEVRGGRGRSLSHCPPPHI